MSNLLALSRSESPELLIYGDIGQTTTAQSVASELAQLRAERIRVRINSYGGSVADGLAIYNALRSHPASVVVTVEGVAASIASLIAMAGDTVEMFAASTMMLHAPWLTSASGNSKDLRTAADALDAHGRAMAAAYSRKSRRATEEILELLSDGRDHWFTASEAIAFGLADRLADEEEATAKLPAGYSLPAQIAARLQGDHPMSNAQQQQRKPESAAAAASELEQAKAELKAVADEKQRRSDVQQMMEMASGRIGGRQLYGHLYDELLNNPEVLPAEAGRIGLVLLARDCQPLNGRPPEPFAPRSETGGFFGDEFIEAAADGLLLRAGVRISKPHAAARDYATRGIEDLARSCITRSGRRVSGDPIRAALSTSDFPLILENSLGKALRMGYEDEPQSHRAWVRAVLVPDFKQQSRPILGSAPNLDQIQEYGEYQYGSMDEDRAVYSVLKYGKMIRVSLEAFVNDDLGAFLRMPAALGAAARRKEADLVYALFDGDGQVMQDSVALFHASHSNLAASASALDSAALGSARTLLRKQTAVGGGLLNLQPRFLIVPAELEQAAEVLLAASSRTEPQGSDNESVPNWISRLTLVVEPRLAATAAYVAAGANQIDTLELAGLERDNGQPTVEEEQEFAVDAKAWKVRHSVAARFLDWRGIVKIPIS